MTKYHFPLTEIGGGVCTPNRRTGKILRCLDQYLSHYGIKGKSKTPQNCIHKIAHLNAMFLVVNEDLHGPLANIIFGNNKLVALLFYLYYPRIAFLTEFYLLYIISTY